MGRKRKHPTPLPVPAVAETSTGPVIEPVAETSTVGKPRPEPTLLISVDDPYIAAIGRHVAKITGRTVFDGDGNLLIHGREICLSAMRNYLMRSAGDTMRNQAMAARHKAMAAGK